MHTQIIVVIAYNNIIVMFFTIYYKVNIQKKKQPSLRPVFTDHFKITKVDSRCTLKEFCKQQGIQANKFNVLLELGAAKEGDKIRDVLLADKVCIKWWILLNISDCDFMIM